MKENFLKIIRTIIGLPIVLGLWAISVACMLFLLALVHIGSTVKWVLSGRYMREYGSWQMREQDEIEEACIFSLLLPYHFIKRIWGKL